ncbi:hypothetical protein BDF21DRAFT_416934 [Thamnidium elegans]|nr:hypothetical protein BDF21DRAFT_416934 [Thamnidium elegans]
MKCAITGHRLYFDHIQPLNDSKHDPTSWSAKNLQLMSSLISSIKGHIPNQEIVKWYSNIIQAKPVEL